MFFQNFSLENWIWFSLTIIYFSSLFGCFGFLYSEKQFSKNDEDYLGPETADFIACCIPAINTFLLIVFFVMANSSIKESEEFLIPYVEKAAKDGFLKERIEARLSKFYTTL